MTLVATLASYSHAPVQVPSAPSLTQLAANAPGEAAEADRSTAAPATCVGGQNGLPGPWLWQFQPFGELASKLKISYSLLLPLILWNSAFQINK